MGSRLAGCIQAAPLEDFDRRRDADEDRDTVSQQARNNIRVNDRLTFSELADGFRSGHIKANVRETTALDYERLLKHHLEPYFATWRVSDIQRQEVLNFRAEAIDRGVGPRTINKALSLLGTMFRYGMLNNQVHHNPTVRTKLKNIDHSDTANDVIALSLDEQRALVDAADPRWRLLIMTAAYRHAPGGAVRPRMGRRWAQNQPNQGEATIHPRSVRAAQNQIRASDSHDAAHAH